MSNLYKEDGINISAGDAASAFAGRICRESYGNSPYVEVHDLSQGNFRGPRCFTLKGLPFGIRMTGGMDGVGTKVILTDAAGNHLVTGADVFGMTGMDITRWGGIPLIFMSVLDVSKLGEVGSKSFQACLDIYTGMGQVAKEHQFVIFNGETAELGPCVGSENPSATLKYNVAGCMLGLYHVDKMILGNTLASGQSVIVFQDSFRSNGLSSVRKALSFKYGPEWWSNPLAKDDIALAAAPSVQYDRMFNYLHGWNEPSLRAHVKFHLIVHLSGGAFKGKFGDLLKALGLSAELPDLFEPSDIMRRCAEWRGMTSSEFYETLNGGQGALAVVDESEENRVIDYATSVGISAKVAGRITEKQGYTVTIKSRLDGEVVHY